MGGVGGRDYEEGGKGKGPPKLGHRRDTKGEKLMRRDPRQVSGGVLEAAGGAFVLRGPGEPHAQCTLYRDKCVDLRHANHRPRAACRSARPRENGGKKR